MTTLLLWLNAFAVVAGFAVLVLLIRANELKTYWPMLIMANWEAPPYFVLSWVRHLGRSHISPMAAYHWYFYTYWVSFAVACLSSALLTYLIFRAAMRPLKGLQSLGNIMFLWAAGISLATAVSAAASPSSRGADQLLLVVSQLQRSSAILIVSLMLFVALSIRPMGLSFKSRVFGATAGTMIASGTNLLQANYLLQTPGIFESFGFVRLVSSCIALCIWAYYFAIPEPKRKFILLPTDSPFHSWNRVSQMLKEKPGVVAIGGIAPEVIAPAELEVFLRASPKMKAADDRQAGSTIASGSAALNKVQLTKN